MKLTLGFSPCPNDTFIFDALIHGKVDTEGLSFEVQYEDVETLNKRAFERSLDITKLSYHAFAFAAEHYVLMDAGSALGFGVGPLLISRDPQLAARIPSMSETALRALRVGIPGKYTTANFLLGLAFPAMANKRTLLFSGIENALLSGEIDLGLIIHENRFTYEARGLHKVEDLGDFWERTTGRPIPLGGIVARRDLPEEVKQKINRVLRRSVQFAFDHPESGIEFIRSHAQAMDDAVMYQHIELYVNAYSLDLGTVGREAIQLMFDKAHALDLIPSEHGGNLFLNQI